jgi:release factor glutamine methyltransferase
LILRETLQSTRRTLRRAGISDGAAEAELLIGYLLGMSRTQLYTQPERDLTPAERDRLRDLVRRRLDHEPAAYILGHWEFYGSDFWVDCRTLIPRPETELLVGSAVEAVRCRHEPEKRIKIVDVGTGCGAIAISLALALPRAEIYATDASASALQVAEINCRRYAMDGRVTLLHGNLLEPLPQPVDMVVANLPYIKDSEVRDLAPEIRNYEPAEALAGGEDGLDKIRKLLAQMPSKVSGQACCLLEVGQGQGEIVTSLIKNHFPKADVELFRDLGGIERVVRTALGNE